MAKKATTNLNREEQAICRLFVERIASNKKLVGGHPADAQAAIRLVMALLGYQVLPTGKVIPAGVEAKTSYGGSLSGEAYSEYEDEYSADGQRLGVLEIEYNPMSSQ